MASVPYGGFRISSSEGSPRSASFQPAENQRDRLLAGRAQHNYTQAREGTAETLIGEMETLGRQLVPIVDRGWRPFAFAVATMAAKPVPAARDRGVSPDDAAPAPPSPRRNIGSR